MGPADLGATLPSGPPWQSLLLGMVLTTILMFVVLIVWAGVKKKDANTATERAEPRPAGDR